VFQLTSRAHYGVLAVHYIAQRATEEFISIDEIVESSHIPKPYLSKILQDLCRGGILLSRRGTGGGFTLSRPPGEISLRDIIEVIDGKLRLVNCLLTPPRCDNVESCPISRVLMGVQNFILEIIASISMDDIINAEKKQKMLALLEMCRTMYQEKVYEVNPEKQHT
jgi:Rrf2 family protein